MKKYLLMTLAYMLFTQVNAQLFRNLKYWQAKGLLDTIYNADANTLSAHINYLDSSVLLPFKVSFDAARKVDTLNDIRKHLRDSIKIKSDIISGDIIGIKNDRYYGNNEKNNKKENDTSFLYYYTNKELNDYLQSLTSLKQEMNFIFRKPTNHMDGFDNTNFLNAYYNMAQSRSLLLAAMDNLKRYYMLGSEIDSIKTLSMNITKKTELTEKAVNSLTVKIDDIYNKTNQISLLLNKPYEADNKEDKKDTTRPKDKITTATDAILGSKKNNLLSKLLVGTIGGLVAGILVALLK